ncbi:MAG: C40 family peptidase [Burkholderiales bacterium]|nr:C40 family peptidase [Burkholderiales bacterium]
MKILKPKNLINCLVLGAFTLFSSSPAFADNDNSSDPIAAVASANDTPDNSSSNANVTKPARNSQNDNNAQSQQSQDAISNMLLQSVSLMGIAYKWGGNTPDTGMDCSGFVRYVFNKSLGINLPRTAAEMAKVGKRVSIDQLQPGDLIFFNSSRGSNTHIGIYLGGNKFIQSPRTGETIQITDLSGYWTKHFNGAKRIVQETQDDSGNSAVQSFQNVRDQALPVAARASGKRHGRASSRSRSSSKSNKSNRRNKSTVHKSTKSTTASKKKKKHN